MSFADPDPTVQRLTARVEELERLRGDQLLAQMELRRAAEAELAEARQERDTAKAERQAYAQAGLEQIDRHRAELEIVMRTRKEYVEGWMEKCAAVEAERDALAEALQEIADMHPVDHGLRGGDVARAALGAHTEETK